VGVVLWCDEMGWGFNCFGGEVTCFGEYYFGCLAIVMTCCLANCAGKDLQGYELGLAWLRSLG